MLITVGKHAGKTTQEVLLKEPAYAMWVMDQPKLNGALASIRRDLIKQMELFNSLPLTVKCSSEECTETATYAAVYRDSVASPTFWCDDCEPYALGAPAGALQFIREYRGALLHVNAFCSGKVTSARSLIKALARAKR